METMIIFTQIGSKKYFLLVLKEPAMFNSNILYFVKYFAKILRIILHAKYFAKYSKPYCEAKILYKSHFCYDDFS